MKKEVQNKTLIYAYDPEAEYVYNKEHGTEYPYNSFPTGANGKKFMRTRFKDWEPLPEDIIIRHHGSQIFVNFKGIFPPQDIMDDSIQVFQLRSKRVDVQNYICEQINFFTALYDDENELLTGMLVAKYITDSQRYTIATFEEYYKHICSVLFSDRIMAKIAKMTVENDVGDVTVGLFPEDFLRDMFILSFMIKVMHIYIEHFIISTGNSPKDQFKLFAEAYTYMMNNLINENMYKLLFNYVNNSVLQSIKSNTNIIDMQAIDGKTAPTIVHDIIRRTMLVDGLMKLTYASAWDSVNKRPLYSCVGFVKSIIARANTLIRKAPLRYSLVNVDDISQLLIESVSQTSSISQIRSFNPGEFVCMSRDLNIVIAQIAMEIDLSPVEFYLENLPKMNDLSKILIDTVLYNKFHSSISTNTLNTKQKYILLMYVRHLVLDMYGLSEEQTVSHPLVNILTAKVSTTSTKTLTQKELNAVRKYIKLNNLKEYLLNEKNVNTYVESITSCVLNSYTIVNHNDPSLIGSPLVYDSSSMTLNILDMIVGLFEYISR